MKRFKAWPLGLVGQAALILLLAVLLELVGSAVTRNRVDLASSRGDQAHHLAEHILSVEAILSTTPPSQRVATARSLATPDIRVDWERPPSIAADAPSRLLDQMHTRMTLWRPALASRDLRLTADGGALPFSPRQLSVALQMQDGSWIRLTTGLSDPSWLFAASGIGSAIILTLSVLAASGLMLRTLGAPLRTLAQAAVRIGEGERVQVPEEGPADVRGVARAFNTMQTRIADLSRARIEALAAVSHDLRTPLARLGLRLEAIENPAARQAAASDVAEMRAMLDSLLSYLRGEDGETPRPVDLAALVMAAVDDHASAGLVDYVGPDRVVMTVRPVALKRAVTNLVENAVLYGSQDVRVLLEPGDDEVVIAVEDSGPGIAPDMLVRAIEPFQRLDGARSRNTAGMGLGLSIVAAIARDEGGTLQLSNRPSGGLRAAIKLPCSAK